MKQYIIDLSLLHNDSINTDNKQSFFLYSLKKIKGIKKVLAQLLRLFHSFDENIIF